MFLEDLASEGDRRPTEEFNPHSVMQAKQNAIAASRGVIEQMSREHVAKLRTVTPPWWMRWRKS